MARIWKRNAAKESHWRRALADHIKSGLTIRDFCRQRNLAEPGFYYWRREIARRDHEQLRTGVSKSASGQTGSKDITRRSAPISQRPTPVEFKPIRVIGSSDDCNLARPSAVASGAITIEFSSGVSIHAACPIDRHSLATVLSVLESRSC